MRTESFWGLSRLRDSRNTMRGDCNGTKGGFRVLSFLIPISMRGLLAPSHFIVWMPNRTTFPGAITATPCGILSPGFPAQFPSNKSVNLKPPNKKP